MFTQYLDNLNDTITLYLVCPLIFFVGLYLSFRLKFLQISKIKTGLSYLFKKEEKSKGDISHFEAISTVLAGNLGTGNISGIAVALTMGGPGALVWMWVMAFFGAIIKFAGCLLSVRYRHQNPESDFVGGPMYYLDHGLNLKSVARAFAIFAIFTSLTVGNLVQVNSISLPLATIGWHPIIVGVLLAIFVAFVLIGGGHRFAVVAATVVPIMAFLYLSVAIYILLSYYDKILPAFGLMFQSALYPTTMAKGALGYGVMRAVTTGFERGVFATDAGTGIAPILQASTRTKSPVIEGIVAMVAPLVVMVICTITGLVLIVTDAWQTECLQSTNMCTWAFTQGFGNRVGFYVVVVSLILFAFTTILAWAYCAEKAVEYLWGLKWMRLFQWLYGPIQAHR